MEDTKIIELYWQRAGSAIDETEKKYGRMCRSLAENILNDPLDSEECVNDTYLNVWQSIPTQRPAHFAAFLAAITRRLSIDALRRRNAAKRGGGAFAVALEELAECLPSEESVEAQVEARELAEILDGFLDSLKETDRNMFVCRYWLCANISEIAQRLHVTESRVKSSLMRSRKRLGNLLSEVGYR